MDQCLQIRIRKDTITCKMQIYKIEIFETAAGVCPYIKWLEGLSDKKTQAKIMLRIQRASLGNMSNVKSVGAGVHEFKVDYGPGYRVYFGLDERERKIILLLCGGTKKKQQKDIEQAQLFWQEAKAEKRVKRRESDAAKKLSR